MDPMSKVLFVVVGGRMRCRRDTLSELESSDVLFLDINEEHQMGTKHQIGVPRTVKYATHNENNITIGQFISSTCWLVVR